MRGKSGYRPPLFPEINQLSKKSFKYKPKHKF